MRLVSTASVSSALLCPGVQCSPQKKSAHPLYPLHYFVMAFSVLPRRSLHYFVLAFSVLPRRSQHILCILCTTLSWRSVFSPEEVSTSSVSFVQLSYGVQWYPQKKSQHPLHYFVMEIRAHEETEGLAITKRLFPNELHTLSTAVLFALSVVQYYIRHKFHNGVSPFCNYPKPCLGRTLNYWSCCLPCLQPPTGFPVTGLCTWCTQCSALFVVLCSGVHIHTVHNMIHWLIIWRWLYIESMTLFMQ